jgi:hypothetical protein
VAPAGAGPWAQITSTFFVLRRVEDRRHVTARTVQMRLQHLQDQAGGHGGVEGVAALFQNAHADRRGDPVGRGDDAETAEHFGPGGERRHAVPPEI